MKTSRFTVLWDNDGVLVDTEELYFAATRETLAVAGLELTTESFVDHSLRRGRSAFDLARARGVSAAEVERLRDERNARYSELLRRGSLVVDGVEKVLQSLHGRVRMGVVTGSRRDHFDVIHSSSGLLRYFDFVLTREDYEHSKPHPDPYLAALRLHEATPADVIVVEDSERGLLSALAAGLRCLVIPNRLTKGGDFRGAYRVLETVREVRDEVLRLAAG